MPHDIQNFLKNIHHNLKMTNQLSNFQMTFQTVVQNHILQDFLHNQVKYCKIELDYYYDTLMPQQQYSQRDHRMQKNLEK